ncbi:hypothetical protein N665_1942s0006 [Sinapis alba]|nr:hypothetical protein N665_1942s0006 [Sinapis alba]
MQEGSHVRVERDLPLGVWRLVTNFSLSNATGQYRPTNHAFKMSIIGDSKIMDSDFHCDDMFFSFSSYEDVGNGSIKSHFLIEVIGQVESLKDDQTVQVKGRDKKKVEFQLRDTRGETIACCLWGKYAEQIETHIQEANDPNMILVVRFAKIGFYKGEVQITNAFGASLVLINPDLPEVMSFKSMVPENETSLTIFDQKSNSKAIKAQTVDWNEVDIKSISEILVAMKVEHFKIIVSIETIDTYWSGFYFGHDRCNKHATKITRSDSANLSLIDKPLWRCERCRSSVINVSPKYKLHIVVQDDSGTCKLMLLDTEAQAIIVCKAGELWDGSYDEAIKELVGKSFCFRIVLANDNVTNGSDIFMVSEIWSGDKLLKAESQSEPLYVVSKSDPNSQTTSEGCSTPFSKRKDGDLLDMT